MSKLCFHQLNHLSIDQYMSHLDGLIMLINILFFLAEIHVSSLITAFFIYVDNCDLLSKHYCVNLTLNSPKIENCFNYIYVLLSVLL